MFDILSSITGATPPEGEKKEIATDSSAQVSSVPNGLLDTLASQQRPDGTVSLDVDSEVIENRIGSVRASVHEQQVAFLETAVASGSLDAEEAKNLGEAYLKQGASSAEYIATYEAAVDALVDATFERVRDGEESDAEAVLRQGLAATFAGMARGLDGYERAADTGKREYADAVSTIEAVLEAIPFPVYMLDADTRVIGWNYGHTALVGMTREEAIGKTAQESVVKATYSEGARKLTLAEKVIEHPRRAHEEYGVTKYETPYSEYPVFYDTSTATNLNDETIYLEFWAVPMFDEEGEFQAVFEILKDRTEEVHRQEAMEGLVTEITETLREVGRGNLTARASFEDKNDAVDDDVLDIITEVNSFTEKLQTHIKDVASQTSELRDSSGKISQTSQTIAGSADDQVEIVENVSDEVAQMSAAVEEIAATAEDIAETTAESKEISQEMQRRGEDAREILEDAASSADNVAGDVETLQEHIEQIDEVVDVIDDIAEQTNMLALNASIEAARAGEEGEGFAVVADEVKSLAEESQSRAKEIDEMVGDIQEDTEETVSNLQEMNEQVYSGIDQVQASMEDLQQIVDQIEATADSMDQVSDSTDDQAKRTQEVANLADELVSTAQEVSTEIEQVADANATQTEQIDEIDGVLQKLSGSETVEE